MKSILNLFCLCLVTAITSCSKEDKTPPITAEITGKYRGKYGGGIETFEIWTNGTFSQTFQIGTNTAYAVTGKWHFEKDFTIDGQWQVKTNVDGKYVAQRVSNEKQVRQVNWVKFEPFMLSGYMASKDSFVKVDGGTGDWKRNPIRIEFGEWPYFVAKVSGQGAMVDSARVQSP